MEALIKRKREQRNTERFVLILYSIHHFCMFLLSVSLQWEAWVSVFIIAALAASWVVHVGKYRDYHFRAMFTVIMLQFSMATFSVNTNDMYYIFIPFLASVVLMGLYAMVDLVVVTVISSTFFLFFHGVIKQTIHCETTEEAFYVVMMLGNIYFVQYLVYFWVKQRNETNKDMMKVINELKLAEQSKDDFLANVSHEIRTPINTISGMSEMVLQEDDPQKIREDVLNIQMAGRSLMSVVSDILDFSELQSGKLEIEQEAYNLTSTMNDVINMSMVRKKDKNVELIVDCDTNIPCGLLGDEKKIRRVIMNLVNNALKFTEEGCVTISAESRKESYGVNLIITVRDTGIGMREESLEKLFTTFNQVDTRRSRPEGGIGLGLAISQAIIQKMGGIITVRSKYGKGSALKVVIPQKVLDERPIVHLEKPEEIHIAVYINMEQFGMVTIRDEYLNTMRHMIEDLRLSCRICRNLAELKRRVAQEEFSHIFISDVEYLEDPGYFDALVQQIKIIVVLDREDDQRVTNPNMHKIYKPLFVLPLVSALNEDHKAESLLIPVHRNSFTAPDVHVLVVDDNEMNIQVIAGLLERYRIRVTEAASGQEALEKIESMDYDFVFMDHMMPEMDGVETFHRIRRKAGSYYRNVPIIALTANAIAGAREMLLGEGFTDFLEKPVEISVLERVLKRNVAEEKIIYEENEEIPKQQETGPAKAADAGDASSGSCIEGLDTEKGILYCGGREQYISILKRYVQKGEANWRPAEEQFANEDWKNYTITVHAVKSSMLTIGAVKLSEMAKKLELAGKSGDTAYIKQNHGAMIAEYQRVIHQLQADPDLCPEVKKNAPKRECPELTDEAFEAQAIELEDAMYALDGARMIAVVTYLQKYQYHGTPLEEPLQIVRQKVEMSDYMSAVEVVLKLKDKLKTERKEAE